MSNPSMEAFVDPGMIYAHLKYLFLFFKIPPSALSSVCSSLHDPLCAPKSPFCHLPPQDF